MGRINKGSVFEKGGIPGNWYVSLSFEGRRYTRRVKPPKGKGRVSEAWARAVLGAMLTEIGEGRNPFKKDGASSEMPITTTYGEYAQRWLETRDHGAAASDLGFWAKHMRRCPLMTVSLSTLLPRDCLSLIEYIKRRPLAPRSQLRLCFINRRIVRAARLEGYFPHDPWQPPPGYLPKDVDAKAGARDGWLFSEDEARTLCLISDRLRAALYAVYFFTGCRTGEALALKVGDIRETRHLRGLRISKNLTHNGTLKQTKTNAARMVPIHPELEKALQGWLRSLPGYLGREATPDDFLFPGEGDPELPLQQYAARHAYYYDLERLGWKKRRIYSTRRTHISLLHDAGVSREVFVYWTHGKGKEVIDRYTSASWKTLCDAMKLFPLTLDNASDNASEVRDTIESLSGLGSYKNYADSATKEIERHLCQGFVAASLSAAQTLRATPQEIPPKNPNNASSEALFSNLFSDLNRYLKQTKDLSILDKIEASLRAKPPQWN